VQAAACRTHPLARSALLLPAREVARRKQSMGRSLVALFLRVVLAFGLLAAVGARFGLFDAPAAFDSFAFWTTRLFGLAPQAIVPVMRWIVPVLELVLALLLLVGVRTRLAALVTGILFVAVAAAMSIHAGWTAPFHAAVLTTAAAAFALQAIGAGRVSLDGA